MKTIADADMDMKKPRAVATGTLVGTRFQAATLALLDDYRRAQSDVPTRPEAIRRLVEKGLQRF